MQNGIRMENNPKFSGFQQALCILAENMFCRPKELEMVLLLSTILFLKIGILLRFDSNLGKFAFQMQIIFLLKWKPQIYKFSKVHTC